MKIHLPIIQPVIRRPLNFDVLITAEFVYYTDGEMLVIQSHSDSWPFDNVHIGLGAYNLIQLYGNIEQGTSMFGQNLSIDLGFGGRVDLQASAKAQRCAYLDFIQRYGKSFTLFNPKSPGKRLLQHSSALGMAYNVFISGAQYAQYVNEEIGLIMFSTPYTKIVTLEKDSNHNLLDLINNSVAIHA